MTTTGSRSGSGSGAKTLHEDTETGRASHDQPTSRDLNGSLLSRVKRAPGSRGPSDLTPSGGQQLGIQRLALYMVLAAGLALSIFPFYWMFVVGSNSTAAVNQIPPAILPGGNFAENAAKVFANIPFLRAILNSVIVASTVTVSVLFFSSLAGFAFAKLQFKGRSALFLIVVATLMIPHQLGLIPLYIIMAELGWINTLKAVIVPGLVTAFGVFFMRQYVTSSIPDELLEAGRVDGCSSFRLYWNIALPAIRPAAATLGLITFMFTWNDFLWPLVVLKDQDLHTIQVALRSLNGAYYRDYAMVLAGTFMGTLPILIAFLFLGRHLISGLLDGSLKG